jgi:hypothetical protein
MRLLKSFFSRLGSYLSSSASRDMAKAVDLVRIALPVVERIARMTPNRSDDELVRLFREYGVPGVDRWLLLDRQARGRALMHVATTYIKTLAPEWADRMIDLAVQAAVVEFKAK